MTTIPTPRTPGKNVNKSKTQNEFDDVLKGLKRWHLGLEDLPGESPSRREEKRVAAPEGLQPVLAKQHECVDKIRMLCWKNLEALKTSLQTFEIAAGIITKGWISKPRADPDTLRATTMPASFIVPVTNSQRLELLEYLSVTLDPIFKLEKEKLKERPLSRATSFNEEFVVPAVPVPPRQAQSFADTRSFRQGKLSFNPRQDKARDTNAQCSADIRTLRQEVSSDQLPDKSRDTRSHSRSAAPPINTEPLPIDFNVPRRGKRPSDGAEELNDGSKKPKRLVEEDFSRSFYRQPGDAAIDSRPQAGPLRTSTSKISFVESTMGRNTSFGTSMSTKTSFASTGVFSTKRTSNSFQSLDSLFSSVDNDSDYGLPNDALKQALEGQSQITYYGSNPFDTLKQVSDGQSQSTHWGSTPDFENVGFVSRVEVGNRAISPTRQVEIAETEIEDKMTSEWGALRENSIHESLKHLFPEAPRGLESAYFPVQYEITRICLHAQVAIIDPMDPIDPMPSFEKGQYREFWHWLKERPILKGKTFPDESSSGAWDACFTTFRQVKHSQAVVFSATLNLTKSSSGPLLELRLKPLHFDRSYRLSRRFGPDRFLELTIPEPKDILHSKSPSGIKEVGGASDKSERKFTDWLLNESHHLLGRDWKAFFAQNLRLGRQKANIPELYESEKKTGYRINLFAVSGVHFLSRETRSRKEEIPPRHRKMTISSLLNWLIPFQNNSKQTYLKLFSRINLGLSKTWSTIVLEEREIFYKDDVMSRDGKTVMNDGCGRMSHALARRIKNHLGLNEFPSAYQGRIAGAKGLWIIDSDSRNSEDSWIEIYASQRKWDFADPLDPEHRTFEVCTWSKPLRPGTVNEQFLPILEQRAINSDVMRRIFGKLLVQRIELEREEQVTAMNNPAALRVWIAKARNRILEDRLKYGYVPYRAGLPITLEEKLIMLIDAGFSPKTQSYMRELAWKAYTTRCESLKENMKVIVGRSTYALVAVDFSGVLEPNEVHLGFSSSFKDEMSDWDDTVLHDIDILVARSPAHLGSDIQKARAVWKAELQSLKNVVIFSSKGNIPLAHKLSGGDYDGDIVWICWDPLIVDNFQNVDVPAFPDLVRKGYISKDLTTYSDIMAEPGAKKDPVPLFLSRSFDFTFQDSLLGICTRYKDDYCYTAGTMESWEAILLCKLLSDLVDQVKQGLTFTRASFDKIKKDEIKTPTMAPAHRETKDAQRRKTMHILDYLKLDIAWKVIEDAKTKFWKPLDQASYTDLDLVKLANDARRDFKDYPELEPLVTQLEDDLAALKKEWAGSFSSRNRENDFDGAASKKDFDGSEWAIILNDIYDKYKAIEPEEGNRLGAWLRRANGYGEPDEWTLYKASFLYASYQNTSSTFMWWMAGRELAILKAKYSGLREQEKRRDMVGGGGIGGGCGYHPVASSMYVMLGPDRRVASSLVEKEEQPELWDMMSQVGDDDIGTSDE